MRLTAVAAALLAGTASAGCSSVGGFFAPDDWSARGPMPSGPAPSLTAAQGEFPAFRSAPLTPPALLSHISTLSSDQFGGRAPGTAGEDLTISYISRAFAALGLQPGVPGRDGVAPSYLQEVPIVTATLINQPVLQVGADAFQYGADFVAWTRRGQEVLELRDAELVFVGYGVVSPELGWNDYAGADLTGKIAVILVNDPDFETGDNRGFSGRAMTYFGRWTYKIEEAARHGAAGVLLIHEDAAAGYGWPVVVSSWSGPQHDLVRADGGASNVAVEGWIQNAVARRLFAQAGLDFDAEKRRAQRPDFSAVPLNQTASIDLVTQFTMTMSHNVVGVLPGAERPQETVVYGAHWDHLGQCPPVNGDDICNGAQDNASGVAGLIELARRFASTSARPQRSVAFIAFTAEESGLLGSAYYAEHPIFAPADTAAMINMDGLSNRGIAREIAVVGYGQTDLQDLLVTAATAQGRTVAREPYPERGSYYRSDQLNFARIGVPVLYTSPGLDLFDGGVERGRALASTFLTERYHKPDDELTSDWDMSGAMRDLQLLYTVGRQVAEGSTWPQWSPNSEFRAIREASRRDR
ncbi:MAG: M28 family metallopeptidase [Hyphomonadaceae bacterium]|nr:M28 family metallopeptidase [Hyphomonadaceae bacterium]